MEQKLHNIMASFHLGLWEFLPHIFFRKERKACDSRTSTTIGVFIGRQRDPLLGRLMLKIRQGRYPESNSPRYYFSLKELISFLRGSSETDNMFIGFMLDNTSRGKQVDVRCVIPIAIGDPGKGKGKSLMMRLPVLPFELSREFGGGVIPLFCYLKNGRLCVRVFPAGDEVDCVRALFTVVREHPEEWVFWGKRLDA